MNKAHHKAQPSGLACIYVMHDPYRDGVLRPSHDTYPTAMGWLTPSERNVLVGRITSYVRQCHQRNARKKKRGTQP